MTNKPLSPQNAPLQRGECTTHDTTNGEASWFIPLLLLILFNFRNKSLTLMLAKATRMCQLLRQLCSYRPFSGGPIFILLKTRRRPHCVQCSAACVFLCLNTKINMEVFRYIWKRRYFRNFIRFFDKMNMVCIFILC